MKKSKIGMKRKYFFRGLMFECLYLGKTKIDNSWLLLFLSDDKQLLKVPKQEVVFFY